MKRGGNVVGLQREQCEDMSRDVHLVEQWLFGFGMPPCLSQCWHECGNIDKHHDDDRDCRVLGQRPWDETEKTDGEKVVVDLPDMSRLALENILEREQEYDGESFCNSCRQCADTRTLREPSEERGHGDNGPDEPGVRMRLTRPLKTSLRYEMLPTNARIAAMMAIVSFIGSYGLSIQIE